MSKQLPKEIEDALLKYRLEMGIPWKHKLTRSIVKISIDVYEIVIPTRVCREPEDSHHYYLRIFMKNGIIVCRRSAEYIDVERRPSRWQPQYGCTPLAWDKSFAHLRERMIRECTRRLLPFVHSSQGLRHLREAFPDGTHEVRAYND